mmetsp:Transcript_4879/g.13562  ORF Transcript_4879/g.13562 Transcript_4879/m.13562 type:complete len:89 (+) Transcript_4879:2666-2932(+)
MMLAETATRTMSASAAAIAAALHGNAKELIDETGEPTFTRTCRQLVQPHYAAQIKSVRSFALAIVVFFSAAVSRLVKVGRARSASRSQ